MYFAYSVPYSYSDLRNDLYDIESNEARAVNVSRKVMCKTLAGEDCEVLTITSRDNSEDTSRTHSKSASWRDGGQLDDARTVVLLDRPS